MPRGRPKGSTNKPKKVLDSDIVDDLAFDHEQLVKNFETTMARIDRTMKKIIRQVRRAEKDDS